jgi:replication factor C subunit 2/4
MKPKMKPIKKSINQMLSITGTVANTSGVSVDRLKNNTNFVKPKLGAKKSIKAKNTNDSLLVNDTIKEICDADKNNDTQQSVIIPNFENIEVSAEIKQELKDYKREQLSKIVIPWTEKYRPNKLDDLLIDDITKEKLKKIVANREMPNILITGGPGEGKTSTVLLIAKLILGLNYKEALLELNASDERGIKTHTHVISFCKKKLHFDSTNAKEYAKHKIILLDEADNMTKKAQQSISNLMEVYKNTTRFAFTCNNSADIIEAIQSRCIIFRYNKLNQDQITLRLTHICNLEGIKYTPDGIKSLVLISDGDMRNAVNNLQVMYNSFSYETSGVTQNEVYKLSDKPKPQVIKRILMLCYKRDVKTAILETNDLRDKGYSTADILNCMQNLIIHDEMKEMNVETQHYYLRETSKAFHTINQGIDTALQLNACIIALCVY